MKDWKTLFVLTMLVGFVGGLVGCNTMEGAGEDVEAGAEAVQDAAD